MSRHALRLLRQLTRDDLYRIYDSDPGRPRELRPGAGAEDIDPPLDIPKSPGVTIRPPSTQERFDTTPIYADLT